MNKRKYTEAQKIAMQIQKDSICEEQGGVCFYCYCNFNLEMIYPHAAHIIIPSVVNVRKYGYEILDHRLNFKITCPDCNSRAIINPETQSGKDHIQRIREALDYE